MPATYEKLIRAIARIIPCAVVYKDESGEIMIRTGLVETATGKVVEAPLIEDMGLDRRNGP